MWKRTGVVAFCVICSLSSPPAMARDVNGEAIWGGVIGGAAGAAIGSAIGGRSGALIGAGLGAMTGVSVATDDDDRGYSGYRRNRYYDAGPQVVHVREYPRARAVEYYDDEPEVVVRHREILYSPVVYVGDRYSPRYHRDRDYGGRRDHHRGDYHDNGRRGWDHRR